MNIPHTPGPWRFSHGRISSRAHQTSKDLRLTVIADLDMENDRHGEQNANARLIATAPDMLQLLRDIDNENGRHFHLDPDLAQRLRALLDS